MRLLCRDVCAAIVRLSPAAVFSVAASAAKAGYGYFYGDTVRLEAFCITCFAISALIDLELWRREDRITLRHWTPLPIRIP